MPRRYKAYKVETSELEDIDGPLIDADLTFIHSPGSLLSKIHVKQWMIVIDHDD